MLKRTGHRYIDVESGRTLDTWYPRNNAAPVRHCLAEQLGLIRGDVVEVELASLDLAPVSTEDAYLRLHLLSECAVLPNQLNLEGLFDVLANIAWTSAGPVLPARCIASRSRSGSARR